MFKISTLAHILILSRECHWSMDTSIEWLQICSTTEKLRESLVKPVTRQKTCNYI